MAPPRPARRPWGHLTVNLSRDGKKSSRPVHRLVLEAWVGTCPEGMVACHNDGDRANDGIFKPRRGTPESNADYALRHGTRAMESRCRAAKLTEGEVVEIRRLSAEGVPVGDLAARFAVTSYNAEEIVCK